MVLTQNSIIELRFIREVLITIPDPGIFLFYVTLSKTLMTCSSGACYEKLSADLYRKYFTRAINTGDVLKAGDVTGSLAEFIALGDQPSPAVENGGSLHLQDLVEQQDIVFSQQHISYRSFPVRFMISFSDVTAVRFTAEV